MAGGLLERFVFCFCFLLKMAAVWSAKQHESGVSEFQKVNLQIGRVNNDQKAADLGDFFFFIFVIVISLLPFRTPFRTPFP